MDRSQWDIDAFPWSLLWIDTLKFRVGNKQCSLPILEEINGRCRTSRPVNDTTNNTESEGWMPNSHAYLPIGIGNR